METRFVNYELVELDMSEFSLDDVEGIEKLEVVYLDTYVVEFDGQFHEVNHYPMSDTVEDCEYQSEAVKHKVSQFIEMYKATIAHKVAEAGESASKIYFSPANRVAYVNTTALPCYGFYYKDEDGNVELSFEGNFSVF